MAAANFERGYKTIQRLAEALGLAGQRITAMTIEVRGNDPARVKVEMLAEVPGIEGVCTVLREYRLERIEPPGTHGECGLMAKIQGEISKKIHDQYTRSA